MISKDNNECMIAQIGIERIVPSQYLDMDPGALNIVGGQDACEDWMRPTSKASSLDIEET